MTAPEWSTVGYLWALGQGDDYPLVGDGTAGDLGHCLAEMAPHMPAATWGILIEVRLHDRFLPEVITIATWTPDASTPG